MATEMYTEYIASDTAFSKMASHIHHHSKITTVYSLPDSILNYSGYFENGRSEIR